MNKRYLIGTVLLLSAATAGVGIAAGTGELDFLAHRQNARGSASEIADQSDRPILFASKSRGHDRHGERLSKRDRRHHDDDDDDDDDDDHGKHDRRRMAPQNGLANPNAPIPDNGLFNGNSRPRVQVQ